MPSLQDRFRGCFLGAMMGDIAGAPVEAESPQYIANTFKSVDEILAVQSVPEFTGPAWQVGRFTDDTQMFLCVAQWLLDDASHSPETLLAQFAHAYEPWRRYGSGTEAILRVFPKHKDQWRELATAMFPHGSFGNGSAMRVAPVGLAFRHNLRPLPAVAIASSRPTHSHYIAYQGATLIALAVATAASSVDFSPEAFLRPMRAELQRCADLLQDKTQFARALDAIDAGLKRQASCREMAAILGTDVTAVESVPMALYCFLRHPEDYAQVIHEAIFAGGDTDTIACMAGAISGAFLGASAIPTRWLVAVREETHTVGTVESLADQLFHRFAQAH